MDSETITLSTDRLNLRQKDALLSALKNTADAMKRIKDNPTKLKSPSLQALNPLITNFENRGVTDLWIVPESLSQLPDMDSLLNLPTNQMFAGFKMGDRKFDVRKVDFPNNKQPKYLDPSEIKRIYIGLGGQEEDANKFFDPLISQ